MMLPAVDDRVTAGAGFSAWTTTSPAQFNSRDRQHIVAFVWFRWGLILWWSVIGIEFVLAWHLASKNFHTSAVIMGVALRGFAAKQEERSVKTLVLTRQRCVNLQQKSHWQMTYFALQLGKRGHIFLAQPRGFSTYFTGKLRGKQSPRLHFLQKTQNNLGCRHVVTSIRLMSPSSPHQMSVGDWGFRTVSVSSVPPVPPRRLQSRDRGRTMSSGTPERRVKCVLVGDGAVGKTSLVVSYTTNGYPTEYVPTAFDNFSAMVSVDGHPVRLQLCDTAGQDEFDKLRPLCYTSADVFLLCFSVVSPASFQNVPEKWVPEIRTYAPHTPLVLVGTQCDLREDVKVLIDLAKYRERPVDPAVAKDCAIEIEAVSYIECSSLTQKNLKEVFDSAILASLQNHNSQTSLKGKQKRPRKYKQTPDKMKSLSKSWWKSYCCVT